MKQMFIAIKTPDKTREILIVGTHLFIRPMPWGLWFKAIFQPHDGPWRFARLVELPHPLQEGDAISMEDGELIFDEDHRYKLERPNALLAVLWAIESIYYGTSLRFWRWPVCKDLIHRCTQYWR